MTDAPSASADPHQAMLHEERGRVLIIAGSDSGGGAGVQADIKTVTALGGYAATAITAITVQNTLGVSAVFPLPPELVVAQARCVFDDIGADAIKLGMLGDAFVVNAVADWLDEIGEVRLVVDPVMIAKGGQALLEPTAVEALSERLIPRATLLTPNAPEAAALTGRVVETTDDLRRAGEALLRRGASAVLMKGGHIEGPRVIDILMTPVGETRFESGRIETRHTHGTGCTLASACAFGLARGWSLDTAVTRARDYVRGAIAKAPGFGAGHGPLNHGWMIQDHA
jgi:hydroxymethylpyrimidine/phosphomethylpyrimidine kinase